MGQGFAKGNPGATQLLGIGLSAGTQSAGSSTIVFSNSNGISFGMSGSSQVTASYSTAVLSNSNNISFGTNGSTVTATFAAINAFSAGAASVSNGTLVFSNSNGISFGLNGSTVTAQHLGISYWDNDYDRNANAAQVNSGAINLSVQRQMLSAPMSATRVDLLGHLTVAGSTAGSYSMSFGVYTMNVSTANLASSTSISSSFASGTTQSASQYGGHSGTRWRSLPLATWNLTAGEYLFAFMLSQAGVAGTTGSWTIFGNTSISVNGQPGDNGVNLSAYFADGVHNAATGAFPATIHLSAINQTGTAPTRQPYFQLAGTF